MIKGGNIWKEYSDNPSNIGNLQDSISTSPAFEIESLHRCNSPLEWHGCYRSDNLYKQFITPESYAHPAKASFHLLEKIYTHLANLGLLKPTDTIIDFMAGSGRIHVP